MLTVITGTPGAGKSLYAVWHYARTVPGSTVEKDGSPIPRRLFSNIKDLLVEHQHITATDLETWHEWAQPGDVILFDEVQEVWRPRGLGAKVPDCIAALETHRHKGVDIILITQHPMLVDPNIRRLVNQHLHLRRLAKSVAYVYEWDHCANPGQVKTALQARVWWHPKAAYALYKSAQLHTKPTARIPRIALVGVAALAGFAFFAHASYERLTERFSGNKPATVAAAPGPVRSVDPKPGRSEAALPPAAPAYAGPPVTYHAERPIGCIAMAERCTCFDSSGASMAMPEAACREGAYKVTSVALSAPGRPSGYVAQFTDAKHGKPSGGVPDDPAVPAGNNPGDYTPRSAPPPTRSEPATPAASRPRKPPAP